VLLVGRSINRFGNALNLKDRAPSAVDTAQKRVVTSRNARESAEQQLSGEQKLYEVGRSTTFLLLQRQNELTIARTNELQAQTDYNKALADLQRATAATLAMHEAVISQYQAEMIPGLLQTEAYIRAVFSARSM